MKRVKVGTTADGFEDWSIEFDVQQGTTAAELRELLTGPPHNLAIVGGTKVLRRSGGALLSLSNTEKVTKEMVLLGFEPHKRAPKQSSQTLKAQPVQSQQPATLAPPTALPAAYAPVRKLMTDEEKYLLYQQMEGLKLAHSQLSPGERRARSWGRALAYSLASLQIQGLARRGTVEKPFTFWLINASDEVEGFLAEFGFLDDANFLDRQPCEICLIGEKIRQIRTGAQVAAEHSPPRIRSMTWESLWMVPTRPDLNVILAQAEQTAWWVSALPKNDMQHLSKLLAPQTLLTTRNRYPDEISQAMMHQLGERLIHPLTRCPYSALAGDPSSEYDDNGWFFAVRGLEPLGDIYQMLSKDKEKPKDDKQESNKILANFWGIIDLKYDPQKPVNERVKVLETGDGRSSRFSHAGAEIPKRFRDKYKLDDGASSGKHAVVSANKKLTHDLMKRYGYEHLVPKQACCPRLYDPDLANRIIAELGVSMEELVVLKLCNRSRAAGVLPVPVGELDGVLKEILQPPANFQVWMRQQLAMGKASTLQIEWGCYEEQLRHWWSNECPHFVAEQFCTSMLTEADGKWYDGTMRVAFAIHRKPKKSGVPNNDPISSNGGYANPLLEYTPPADELEVDWIGGYWKLPKEDVESINIRASVISAAKSGTAHVKREHLHEVYAAMGDSVQQLFGGSEPSPSMLTEQYSDQPELATYLTARLAIAMRDLSRVRMALKLASTVITQATDGPVKRSAESFLNRGYGILEAQTPPFKWAAAREYFAESVEMLPQNAASLYLLGMAELELGKAAEAAVLMNKSLILDLDFKAPYVNLGCAYIRLKKFDDAIDVSEAGLKRHPESPQCHYHIGVACYQKVVHLESSMSRNLPETMKEIDLLKKKALDELMMSRDSDEGQRLIYRGIRGGHGKVDSPWLDQDDDMVDALKRCRSSSTPTNRLLHIELPEKVGWRFFGWRN